jgi:hypothetical protein
MKRVPRGMLKSAQFRAFFDEMQKIAISTPLPLLKGVGNVVRKAGGTAAAGAGGTAATVAKGLPAAANPGAMGMRAAQLQTAAAKLEGKLPTTVRLGPETWGRAADKLKREEELLAGRPKWVTP